MFSLFKRLSRASELQHPAARSPPVRQDQPKPAGVDRYPQAEELTTASWPVADRKPEPFLWRGGCCG